MSRLQLVTDMLVPVRPPSMIMRGGRGGTNLSVTNCKHNDSAGVGTTKDLTFWLASWPLSCTAKLRRDGFDTWDHIWKYMLWSFNALFDGKHPTVDHNGVAFDSKSPRYARGGKPLSETEKAFRAFIYAIIGDLDFFHKDLGFPGHNAGEFCWLCNCNRTTNPWTDFNADPRVSSMLRCRFAEGPHTSGTRRPGLCSFGFGVRMFGSVFGSVNYWAEGRQTKPLDQ
jgi:hypothetical protein